MSALQEPEFSAAMPLTDPAPTGAGAPSPQEGRFPSDSTPTDQASTELAPDLSAPFPIRPTTAKLYESFIRTMTRYSENLRREGPDDTDAVPVSLTNLIEDFLERDDLSAGTIKAYRSALLWQARNVATLGRTSALQEEARALIPRLEDARQEAGRPRERDTHTLIPERDYHQLLAELHASAISGSHWASRASAWLMAGVITGVRPGEWTSARWSQHNPKVLVVQTGKAKLCEPAFVRDLDAQSRLQQRRSRAAPIADALHAWMRAQRTRVTDGAATAKALDYSLNRWKALTRYLHDPRLPIDNNHDEQQIRSWATGRKNWLFAGTLAAGRRAAAITSLIQSAKLSGHDPYEYLKDVLERLPTQLARNIDELLPHRCAPAA